MKENYVLITGSSRGLGRQIALTFAKNNYNVILSGRNKKNLEEITEEINNLGVNCIQVQGDLQENVTLDNLSKVAYDKDISVLINNAAIVCRGLPIEELSEKEIEDMINVNLIAPIKLSKRIYSLFKIKHNGAIVNINSIAGIEPKKQRTIYCASKFGLSGFGDSLRMEAKKDNINIINVYLSKMKNEKGDYGMNMECVAQEIFSAIESKNIENLIIDGRLKELQIKEYENGKIIDGGIYN